MSQPTPREEETRNSPWPITPEGSSQLFFRQIAILAMGLLIVVLIIHLLQQFATILQQLLIAVFVIYLILPLRQWLAYRRFSAFVSYFVIIVGIGLIFWILGLMIQESLADLNNKFPTYRDNLTALLEQSNLDVQTLRQYVLGDSLDNPVNPSVEAVRSALLTIFGFAGQVVVVLVYAIFMLAEAASLPSRVRRSFGGIQGQNVMAILERINTSISRYIAVKTFVSLLTGIFTFLILWWCKVDYAILWGIIAFLLNYIPYLGSIVAVVLPGLLAMVQTQNLWWGLWVMFLLNLQQSIIGYWLEPVLAGKRLDLSPFVIIFSLAFWGSIWGAVGMILAVPLVVSLKIILENIPGTRPIASLLAHMGKAELQAILEAEIGPKKPAGKTGETISKIGGG